MVKKKGKQILSLALVFSMLASGLAVPSGRVKAAELTKLTDAQLATALEPSEAAMDKIDNNNVSVHDPSIIENVTKKDGQANYYAFGSHMAVAKTDDLATWTQVSAKENDTDSSLFGVMENDEIVKASFNDAFKANAYTDKITVKYAGDAVEAEVDFGQYNAAAWNTARDGYTISGNMWAPDVIYNTTTEEYCMYLSLNGKTWNSVIILLTSTDIEGPYVYQGPVVYSGFSTSVEELSYENTDLEKVYGPLETLPVQYVSETGEGLSKADDGSWGEFLPHAIDPAVFYDEEGSLRMVYGSWSGGIYEIELDENTGLRDYTVQYDLEYKEGSENKRDMVSDPYFGIHIAGGYYVSGEGPYVEYIDGKYYLFMSYGEYEPRGNYQMRMFSSENPEGPYVDTNGVSAIYDAFEVNFNSGYGDSYDGSDMGAPGSTRGSRLMNSYQWDTMEKGEIAQGHNSAITVDGKSFVIYHAKYDDGTLTHNIRTHELYTVNGCLVAAPYQYDTNVQDKVSYETEEVSGDYDVIFSKYDTNKHWVGGSKEEGGYLDDNASLECEKPEVMSLNADGKVLSGETEIGTWLLDGNKKNVTIQITDAYGDEHITGTYNGIVIEQNADGVLKTCFTGINAQTGIGIWGTVNNNDAIKAIALTEKNTKVDIPAKTYKDLELPTKGLSGAVITWTSSNSEVITDTGIIQEVTEDTAVTLTQKISCGDYYYEKTYDVTVGVVDNSQGKVNVDLTNGAGVTLDNPFYGQEKLDTLYIRYTINWAEDAYKNGYDGLMSFFNSNSTGRVSIQSAPYICYNEMADPNTYIDVKYIATNGTDMRPTELEAGTDYTYEIVITEDGCVVKENGVDVNMQVGRSEGATYGNLLDYIKNSCDKFSWGTTVDKNSFWATEKCTLSDVVITDKIPESIVFGEDSYAIGKDIEPIVSENPFMGEQVDSLEMEYTVNYPTSLDAYGGLFAFYQSSNYGRICQQAMPYLCYNETTGNWMDIKTEQNYTSAGKDIKVKYVITSDELKLFIDGEMLSSLNVSGQAGVMYADLLNYVADCDKFSIGVTGDYSYWDSVASATLSDMNITINSASKIQKNSVTVSKLKVEYDMQGHGEQIATERVAYNALATAPEDPEAVGFRFDGWYTDEECSEEKQWNFAEDVVLEDITLYAKWTRTAEEYTVVFDTKEDVEMEPITVVGGNTVVNPGIVKYEGYHFTGWYSDEECTNLYDFSAPVNKDTTIYAGWEEMESNVVFTLEGPVNLAEQGAVDVDGNYTPAEDKTFANPFLGYDLSKGAEISFTVNKSSGCTNFGALLSFKSSDTDARAFLTPYGFFGVNDWNGNWIDINHPDPENTAGGGEELIVAGEDQKVTLKFTTDNIELYVDDEFKLDKEYEARNGAVDISYAAILTYLETVPYFYLGYGSFWNNDTYDHVNAVIKDMQFIVGESDTETEDVVAVVSDKVEKIGDIYTTDSVAAIEDAKAAYDALSEEEKQAVSEDVKAKLEKAVKDLGAAKEVAQKIDAIGEVTLASEAMIAEAEKAYEALGANKVLVSQTVVEKLKMAKETLAKLQKDDTDAKQEEEEAKKKAEEEAKKKAEEEAKKKAEEEAKKKAEEEAKKKAEEEAKKQAEEAKKKAEEEAKKQAEEAKKVAETAVGAQIMDVDTQSVFTITKGADATGVGGEVEYTGLSVATVTTIVVPSTITDAYGITYNVTKIADSAFLNNKKLKKVTIGANVTEIGKNAFKKCKKLKTVTNKSKNLSVLGEGAFSGVESLTSIDLSKSNIQSIGKNAFSGCKKLKTIKLNGNTLKKVGKNAFKNIKKNAKITIVTKKKTKYNKVVKAIKKSGAKKVKYSQKKK